jgi:hypothetical protein
MVRVMSQSASTVSRNRILKHWDADRDTLTEPIGKTQSWASVDKQAFPYEHSRPLPKVTAQKALALIEAEVKPFPFQLRYVMARPLWFRFTETWCNTGDEKKALLSV